MKVEEVVNWKEVVEKYLLVTGVGQITDEDNTVASTGSMAADNMDNPVQQCHHVN